jgi:hypothetical protein
MPEPFAACPAMVFEQDALCAFKENALARLAHVIEHLPDRIEIGQHRIADLHQFIMHLAAIKLRLAEAREQRVVMEKQAVNLATQFLRFNQINRADGTAANLVFIGRANATACRADLCGTRCFFT